MPPSARANSPARGAAAPVNAPLTWPNSSLSSRPSGRAPQSTATNGAARRDDAAWTARATSSLPVPVSPSTSTVTSALATRSSTANTSRIARDAPTSSPKRRAWLGTTSSGWASGSMRSVVRPTRSVAPAPTSARSMREPSNQVPLVEPRSRTANRASSATTST